MMSARIIAALGASFWLLVAGTPSAEAQPLGIGTSPQGTLTYALGTAFARVLSESEHVSSRVQPSAGTGVMIPLLDRGELDIGFANTLEVLEAYNGTGSFADLRGRAIAYGYTSQEIIKTILDGVMANAGLTINDLRPILVPNLIRGVDEFIGGRVDVGFFALGQAKVAEADASVGGIRFLSLSDAPAAVEAMRRIVPGSYVARVEPGPGMTGVTEPIVTMHYDYVMFVNAGLPAARVTQLTRALAQNKAALAAAVQAFAELQPQRFWRSFAVPYHDGAVAYFRQANVGLVQE
jgi:TRAP-type uncharacterized transport system substrate-binding protein